MRWDRFQSLAVLLSASTLLFGANEAHAAAPPMRWIPAHSSNYSARSSRSIRKVVIHTIEGSEAGAISWFKNPVSNVSAHYVVSYTGRVTQMVRDQNIAWHAGNSSYNREAIGIENEGYAGQNRWTEIQYRTLAQLTRHLCDKYRIPIDRRHIIGHAEVPNQSHWDPGPNFNWTKFMNLVRGSSSGSTPPPPPPPPPTSSKTFAVEITASALRVRSGVWGSILGLVNRGQRFVVRSQRSGWYEIDWRTRRGWISGSYARRVGGEMAVVNASGLNVRTGPSTGYGRLGVAGRGQRYYIRGQSGPWLKIQFDGRTAWFHGGYVRRERLR